MIFIFDDLFFGIGKSSIIFLWFYLFLSGGSEMACCGGGEDVNKPSAAVQSLPYKYLFKYIIVGDTGDFFLFYLFFEGLFMFFFEI